MRASPVALGQLRRRQRTLFLRSFDRSAELSKIDHEATVSRYFHHYVDCGKPGYRYIFRHPGKSFTMLVAVSRLPCLYVDSSPAGVEGAAIQAALMRNYTLTRFTGFLTAVLKLPCEVGQYSLGASKKTLRRKVRKAKQLGVRWAEVNDPDERRKLLAIADEQERTHPNEAHRNPNPDNSGLLKYKLWLVAYSAGERPLLLSVTPIDGDFAFLSYFRTLGNGDEYSNARYMMTEVLVEHLVASGVKYLIEGGSPAIPNGLRHYQRMLGFRIARVRISRSPDRRVMANALEATG